VPYRVVVEAVRRGAFTGWGEPTAVVAPFPTVTHVAFASLLEPFGVAPSLGYELRHFDTTENTTVGGRALEYGAEVPPWFEFFDLPHRSLTAEVANYATPRRAARNAVDEIEHEALLAYRDVVSAYVGATDGLMHLAGDEHMVELLVELAGMLADLRRRHQETRGRPLRIVLFSDHGCGNTKVHHAEGIDRILREAGLHVVRQLAGPDDVVAPKFGLVNFGALFVQDPDRAGTAADAIARHHAVELAVYAPAPDVVEVVSHRGRGRCRWIDDGPGGATRSRYEDDGGDPLRLAAATARLATAGRLDADGYAADDDWLVETAFEPFPDPLRRLRRAMTGDRVRSRASVLYSLGPSWAGGWHSAVVGSWMRGGRLEGTHGGLDGASSLGFLLVADPTFDQPPVVRAEDALARFAGLVTGAETAPTR
jgi:hypothetical protein